MITGFEELRNKEVIDISTGERLGYIDDAEINVEKAEVKSLIIYGRYRLFGIFGREEDITIPCGDIRVIGEDVILADISSSSKYTKRKSGGFKSLFR